MELPPLLIATFLLYSLSATSSALPSPADPQALSPPNPTPIRLQCFESDTPTFHPVDVGDCRVAIEIILHDPSGVMMLQKFGRGQEPPDPSIFIVPSAWHIQNCAVFLSSINATDVAEFRLTDVIEGAQRILRECTASSKLGLGGLLTLGFKSFFVSIDAPPEFVGGAGNRTVFRVGDGAGGGNIESSLERRRLLA